MHRKGKETQPSSQNEPLSEDEYKDSIWANVVDSAREVAETIGDRKLLDWADWMAQGGFRLPEEEIAAKSDEILKRSDDEYETIARRLRRKVSAKQGGQGPSSQ